jgi:hypothetical protein
MTNEPEWRNANPQNDNLSNKGRVIIKFIVGGIAILVLTIIGTRFRQVGLAIGSFSFISGLMMIMRKRQLFYKPGLVVTACGFLLLLTTPRFGIVAPFAATIIFIGAIGLITYGLFQAIKLAWELGKFS